MMESGNCRLVDEIIEIEIESFLSALEKLVEVERQNIMVDGCCIQVYV